SSRSRTMTSKPSARNPRMYWSSAQACPPYPRRWASAAPITRESGTTPSLSRSGAVDAHRHLGDIPAPLLAEVDDALRPTVPVDRVVRVPDVTAAALVVRSTEVDLVGQLVREEQLARVDDVAAEMHLDVDVNGAARVPTGVDRLEAGDAASVGS